MAVSIRDAGKFFQEDDEETLRIISSGSSDVNNGLSLRLEDLARRFKDDHNSESATQCWDAVVESARKHGFEVRSTSSAVPKDPNELTHPSAFETEAGKKHLIATTSLLGISDKNAVQLTMSALRFVGVHKDVTNFQSLLGTRALMKKVVDYHYQQRVARLSVVVECLRKEQERGTDAACAPVLDFLDSIDSIHKHQYQYENGGAGNQLNRGLFKILLSVACHPDSRPTKEQLAPCQDLSTDMPTSLQESYARPSEKFAWNQFVVDYIHAKRIQMHRERTEAMEALLVLLYQRIQGGIQRTDYALLLQAFQSSEAFFTAYPDGVGTRLPRLAGLICAECIGLWRVFSDADGDDTDDASGIGTGLGSWVVEHPLLHGLIPGQNGTNAQAFLSGKKANDELQSLRNLLRDNSIYATDRRKQLWSSVGNQNAEIPESIALLSFGLLQILAYSSILSSSCGSDTEGYWHSFAENGMQMVQIANEENGAFDYLFEIMMDIVVDPPQAERPASIEAPFDWLSFYDNYNVTYNGTEDSTSVDMDAASLTYASIGHEVLNALVCAFQDTILSTDHAAASDNVAMICNLAASIYRNSPGLCTPFWDDWDAYTSTDPPMKRPPMCSVMDSAYSLSVCALRAANEMQMGPEEKLLPPLLPFLQLVSSVCYNAETVESALSVLPKGLIRETLLLCSSTFHSLDNAKLSHCRVSILKSIGILARIGNNEPCRRLLRDSLEGHSLDCDGPRALLRIIAASKEAETASVVLNIAADLLVDAPESWALQMSKAFDLLHQSTDLKFASLVGGNAATQSTACLLDGMVSHLSTISFCKSCSDEDVLAFANVIARGVLCLGTALSSSMSSATSQIKGLDTLPYGCARTIMDCFANLLKQMRPVMLLHESPNVRQLLTAIRHTLITALSTNSGLGDSVAFYACAPVSLSLALSLDRYIEDAGILKAVAKGEDAYEDVSKYGSWHSAVKRKPGSIPEDSASRTKAHLQLVLSKLETVDFDLALIQSKGWIGDEETSTLLHAACAALRLMKFWTTHAEDIAISEGLNENDEKVVSDPEATNRLLSLSPQKNLVNAAIIPRPLHGSGCFSSAWELTRPLNIDLLMRYVAGYENTEKSWVSMSAMTLEILHSCLAHVKRIYSIEAADTILFKALSHNPSFIKVTRKCVERALDSQSVDMISQDTESDINLGLQSLRILESCTDIGSSFGSTMLQADHSVLVLSLCKSVINVASTFEQSLRSTGDQFPVGKVLVSKLRVASGCLRVLRSLWKCKHSFSCPTNDESFLAQLISDTGTTIALLSSLASVIIQFANSNDSTWNSGEKDAFGMGRHCAVLNFMAVALDLLTMEMSWSLKNGKLIDSNHAILKIWESSIKNDFTRLISLPKHFASIDSCVRVATVTEAFFAYTRDKSSRMKPDNHTALLRLFPSVTCTDQELYSFNANYQVDFISAEVMQTSEKLASANSEGCKRVITIMFTQLLFSRQLELLCAWRWFAETLVVLSKNGRDKTLNASDNNSTSLVERQKPFSLRMAYETLQVLHDNAAAVEVAQTMTQVNFLGLKTGKMATILSGLLLHVVDMAIGEYNTNDIDSQLLIDTLGLISNTGEKLLAIMLPDSRDIVNSKIQTRTFCIVAQQLLASAVAVSLAIESHDRAVDNDENSKKEQIYNRLARTSSKVIRVIETRATCSTDNENDFGDIESPSTRKHYRDCLRTCLSMLTLIIAKREATGSYFGKQRAFFCSISEIFGEFDVVKSVVWQTSRSCILILDSHASPPVVSNFHHTACSSSFGDSENVTVVSSALSFIFAIVECGDPGMLSILAESEALQMLSRNPLFRHFGNVWKSQDLTSSSLALRGYVLTGDKVQPHQGPGHVPSRSFFAGRHDPVHELWRMSLKIFNTALRSSKQNVLLDLETKRHFFCMASDLLAAHRDTMMACLKACSLATGSSGMTLNTLREASLILSLVSELCSKSAKEQFRRSYQNIYNEFSRASVPVVVSICSFLGAAGTSRELFQALADIDAAADSGGNIDHGAKFAPLTPVYQLFAGGVQNAKHEAIRYSHFASRYCSAVTQDDYEALNSFSTQLNHISGEVSPDDPRSASKFERNCRTSMTCSFAFRMEEAAADCLFYAVSVLWQTHPAASSFVMFSQEEASRINAMALVKPGMVISFRGGPHPEGNWRSTLLPEGSPNVNFARVLHCNTVDQAWLVSLVPSGFPQGEGHEQRVSENQIAGVEDLTKRSCILGYSAAPESSAEVEANVRSITTGHIILALRWCHQHSVDKPGESYNKRNSGNFVQRLAEQLCMLLGTELSLHAEIGSAADELKTCNSKLLDAQLLDLFRDSFHSELKEDNRLVQMNGMDPVPRRYGRLKTILSESVWDGIRRQLCRELARADQDSAKEQISEQKYAADGDSWFSGIRRSGNRSPFRGLGMSMR